MDFSKLENKMPVLNKGARNKLVLMSTDPPSPRIELFKSEKKASSANISQSQTPKHAPK